MTHNNIKMTIASSQNCIKSTSGHYIITITLDYSLPRQKVITATVTMMYHRV